MLRTLALVPAVIAVRSGTALAQGSGQRFGAIVGGATLSDMDNFPGVGDSRWGGTAGVLVGMNTGPTALTFEANWMQSGGGDVRLDYIELPLTLGAVGQIAGGSGRGRLYSGVSAAFKISCSAGPVADASVTDPCDRSDGLVWGWPIGLQLAKLSNAGSFVGIDVRYTVALSSAFEFADVRNRPWAFRLMFGKQLGS